MRDNKMKKVLILTLTLLLVACGGERSPSNSEKAQENLKDIDKAQETLVKDHILPSVRAFLTAAKDFKTTANEFCQTNETITETKLTELQEKFKTLSIRWHTIEMFNFGPINDDLFSPKRDAINYPINNTNISHPRNFVASHLNTTTGIDFSSLSPREKGLMMLEVLLYETAVSKEQEPAKIVDDYTTHPGKCYLLKGFSELMESDAQYIDDGWNIQHSGTTKPFKDIYLSGTLPNGSKSLVTLLGEIQKYLDYIKKRNVISSTATLSKISYDNADAVIHSIERLLEGTPGKASFFSVMEATGNKNTVDLVKANIATAKQAISSKDASTYNAIIAQLDGNFKREIADALEVSLGLNFSDGD